MILNNNNYKLVDLFKMKGKIFSFLNRVMDNFLFHRKFSLFNTLYQLNLQCND